MKVVEGWFIETINGICHRLFILNGHYVGLRNAIRLYDGPWYLVITTNRIGTEKEIIDSLTEKNRVTIIPKWREEDDEQILDSYRIIDKNNNAVIDSKDVRVICSRIYEI